MSPRHLIALALALSLACGGKSKPVPPPPPPPAPVALASLTEGQQTHGFTATAVYLDDTDQPMGARFVHQGTGFVFDYLRIESAPQGFIWVNSFPTSDQGEPHTQEHLLLGKGNRGRAFGSKQAMSLAESSAFTMQWRTCYHFHTVAGHDVFWDVFDDQLDALINPDYTDEEIRREVRNFGVSKNDDGTLRLEEKGTVYNEMVRSYEQPDRLLWEQAGHMVWGPRHPLAMSQGGEPAAIRTMTPDDIRTFHRDHYYLGNMGMIGAFPGSMELGDVLDHTGAILDRLAGRTGHAMTVADLPPAAGAAPGATAVVDYPSADATQASPMMLVWPATRDLDLTERTLMTLFLDAVAGDESTNLYGALVDGKTRTLDTGATAVWSYVSTDLGQPVYVGLEGVAAAHLTEADEAAVRKVVHDELARIAALPDDAPELKTLAARVSSRLTSQRRALAKFLNSPPAFGFRGTGSEWMGQLLDLERVDGFQKSLTLRPQLAAIEQVLAAGGNPWRSRLEAWGLLDAPYVVAARPSPELRITLDRERKDRATAELARLAKAAGTDDTAKVLRDFAAAYDAETAKLEQAARGQTMPPFIDSPPMTRDDELRYDQAELPGKVPLVTSRFDSMTSSTAGVAFRVDAVAEADLPYLAMLPTLLVDAGLFEDGQATPSEQVKEALRREVLGLSFGYDANPSTGRIELLARGAGNDLDESRRALTWMRRLLASPDWRRANLPRLRDAVAQQLTTLRKTMQGREEDWVEDPATAYWRQRWPQYLHTQSFLTQAHDVHRLRWML
ncbi:MAG: hypothetical protein KC464_32910, partial [Myxococcales bacterium]|nr:hypothetical protein [Myxococcales bacterium]